MKISICDDETDQLAMIGEYVSQYIEGKKLDIEMVKFISPSELLEYEKENGKSRVYILDIVMDGMSGIELGRRIREYNETAAIIYLTTTKEFSLDAFSVNAFSYLIKPFKKEQLFCELDKFFKYHIPPQKEEATVIIRTSEGEIPMAVSKINAVEYLNHRLIYHLTDGDKIESIYRKDPFDVQTEELLSAGAFVKTSNCYLINTNNITTATTRVFKMKNGEEYPITRKYADAKIKFLNLKIKNRL